MVDDRHDLSIGKVVQKLRCVYIVVLPAVRIKDILMANRDLGKITAPAAGKVHSERVPVNCVDLETIATPAAPSSQGHRHVARAGRRKEGVECHRTND
jgi:hypothetical protein